MYIRHDASNDAFCIRSAVYKIVLTYLMTTGPMSTHLNF